jgi:hypothetical protein
MSRIWTAAQIGLLAVLYPDKKTATIAALIGKSVPQIYAKAKRLGIKKSAAYLASPAAGRITGQQGIGTRFTKGHTTWNKGIHYIPGGISVETRFKPGQKPKNHHPIGHERITSDGNTQRKLTDTACTRKDYVNISHIVWIAANGAIPAGHIIRHKDGNNQNCELSNLQCISKADNMRLNSYHRYPAPIPQLIQLRSALNRQLNNRSKS